MEALKVITRPVNHQLIIDLPDSLADDQTYEVVVRSLPRQSQAGRQATAELANSARLYDDLTRSAEASDWESA